MPSCFETPRYSALKARVNALKARLLSMRALVLRCARDKRPELTPAAPSVTRGSIAFDQTRNAPKGWIAGSRQSSPAMTVGELCPSRPWPTWAVITCRSRVNPRSVARRLLGGVLVLAAVFAGEDFFGDEAGVLADRGFDLGGDVGIGFEESLCVLAALSDALAVIGEPGARFLDHARFHPEIDELAALRHAFPVHDVELDLLERRRELVLDHLDAGLVADHLVAFLDRPDPADVEAHRGVEFERVPAGGGLGRAVHDADLHADLVDEDHHGVGAVDRGGELAQRLAHQARLQAGLAVAHFAFELGAWNERRDRIDDQHVDRARAHQRIGDFERLLAGVGLGDQEIVDVDAELSRVDRVERVFGVDEGADAALLLRFRQTMQRERGFAGGFRPVDFDHAAARQAANSERNVEAERAGGDGLHVHRLVVLAEPHDRALAEIALDLRERGIEGLRFIHGGTFDET